MKIKHILTVLFVLSVVGSRAQQLNMADKLPFDPDVRAGRLSNGLTYYIRHNGNPAGLADFYIVHDVGAIQEEDHQTGLAHFLEHMAFGGTARFPGDTMIKWLEEIGLQFGTNINAATGMEMTYYMLSDVPLRRESVIDSALLILRDWSRYISLEEEEVDRQRGIIVEELRQRSDAGFRVSRLAAPYLFGETRYAHRDLLGSEEFLKSFPSDDLRDFYRTWYRPDLQAIVIVGDLVPDVVEEKLISVMSDIAPHSDPRPKDYYPIPDNDQPLIAVLTDPELKNTSINLYIKRLAVPVEFNDQVGVTYMNLLLNAAVGLTNMRLGEISGRPGAPFRGAALGNSPLTVTHEVLNLNVAARNGDILNSFRAAFTELERIRRYGFTQQELDVFRINVLRGAKHASETVDQRTSASYIWEYINHFSKNLTPLSAEHRWGLTQLLVTQMTVGEVNELLTVLLTPTNNVVIISAPRHPDVAVPSEDEVRDMLASVRNSELEEYAVADHGNELIPGEVKPGRIVSTVDGMYGSTVWTLENGIRVIAKHTNYSKHEVIMSAFAHGGLSAVDENEHLAASLLGTVIGASGVGEFSSSDLARVTETKVASVMPVVGRFGTGLSGRAATSDVETLFQLIYLYFTNPRFDREEVEWIIQANREEINRYRGTEESNLTNKINTLIYGDNSRAHFPTIEGVGAIKYEDIVGLYDKLFTDAGNNYTFYFIGDLDTGKLSTLIEKYLGAIPTGAQSLNWADDGIRINPGRITERFSSPMETAQSSVSFTFTGPIEYTQQNSMIMSVLTSCMQSRCIERIREDKSGTYSVNVKGSLSRQPVPSYTMEISFGTDPSMAEELADVVEAELKRIAEEGPQKKDLKKNMEFLSKGDLLGNNNAWLSFLQTYYTWDEDWNTDFKESLKRITPETVSRFAAKIVEDGNMIRLIVDSQPLK